MYFVINLLLDCLPAVCPSIPNNVANFIYVNKRMRLQPKFYDIICNIGSLKQQYGLHVALNHAYLCYFVLEFLQAAHFCDRLVDIY